MGRFLVVAHRVKSPSSTHEDAGSFPGLTRWVKDATMPQVVL